MAAQRAVDARTRALVEAPCRVTMAGAVSPMEDAARERSRATFDPTELATFLHNGEDNLARRWEAPPPPPPPAAAYPRC